MRECGPLLITARLSTPLGQDPPQLDSLLEWCVSPYAGGGHGVPGYKVDRAFPAPRQGNVPIPLARQWLGPRDEAKGTPGTWLISRCSSPIVGAASSEAVEYYTKRIGVEHAALLDPKNRVVVSTTNSWTKSYRLPIRARSLAEVRWFAVGCRRNLKKTLESVTSLGKKRSYGYGRVSEWIVEATDEDYSWFAPSPDGPILMRPLPAGVWIPPGLIGARASFGAPCPPYWHPERYTDIVIPS